MVKKVVIPAINSVLTFICFGSKPNNAFNLFLTHQNALFYKFQSIPPKNYTLQRPNNLLDEDNIYNYNYFPHIVCLSHIFSH